MERDGQTKKNHLTKILLKDIKQKILTRQLQVEDQELQTKVETPNLIQDPRLVIKLEELQDQALEVDKPQVDKNKKVLQPQICHILNNKLWKCSDKNQLEEVLEDLWALLNNSRLLMMITQKIQM